MSRSDSLLMMIAASDEGIYGRTTVQKLAYFAAEQGYLDATFRPHYYGPYSEEVANTLESLTSLGYLREDVIALGEQSDQFLARISGDVKAYRYELTDEGRQVLTEIKGENPEDWQRMSEFMADIAGSTELNPAVLSVAAKVHYVRKRMGHRKKVSSSVIINQARRYHWNLTEENIERATRLLISPS